MIDPIPLMGQYSSPYTQKMLGVLRYRRLPYRYLPTISPELAKMPKAKVTLLPTFYLPDAAGELEAVVDSTPIIRRLELEFGGRSVLPDDPALAFLNDLLEDYADEWLTKAMFHYRWHGQDDVEKASRILSAWRGLNRPDDRLAERAKALRERQMPRLYVVGSNPVTAPIIEASYRRFLEIFEDLLRERNFLFGERPSAADFAIYGQLSQLAQFEPTPMALTLEIAPRTYAWVSMMQDQSGWEPGPWLPLDQVPAATLALLKEMARVYMPVLLANAKAHELGAAEVRTEIDGQPWVQQPYAYQVKCLQWLRATYAALAADERRRVDRILGESGLHPIFDGVGIA